MAICGIAINGDVQPVSPRELTAMVSSLKGQSEPVRLDCDGTVAGLGAVSPLGTASLCSSDALLVASDCDFVNRDELCGAVGNQQTDAALIAALYSKFGKEFVSRLRGAFSFAIWNKNSRTLLLATDRMAMKPLSFAVSRTQIVFASQPRALFTGNRVAKEVDPHAILEYLNYNIIPAPLSVFRGVEKLRPGHLLEWKDGQWNSAPYWDMNYPEDARGSEQELGRQLLDQMQQSVASASADLDAGKAGCYLSGGTDSSSIVGLFGKTKGQPANSFSIGFSEDRFNELNYAHLAAEHFGARQTDAIMSPDDAYGVIPTIVAGYDEPFGNSSVIPTYWCAKVARDAGISTMLAGDGGDELFGGNERYRTEEIFNIYQRVPRPLRRWLIEPVVFGAPTSAGVFGKGQRYIRWSNMPQPERYCQWRLLLKFPPKNVLGPNVPYANGNGDLLAVMRAHYQAAPAKSELNKLLYVDLKMTLADDDLPKVIRSAELSGMRVRFPYLDNPLVEFSGRLPARLKVKGLEKRYLFKVATRNLLPEAILNKKKHGFGLPIGFWLKSDPKLRTLARDVMADSRTYERGYFRREFVTEIFAHMETDDTPYFGDLLWPLLMLELWHRHHVDGRAA